MCTRSDPSCGIVRRNSLQANPVLSLNHSSFRTPGIWLAFSKFSDIGGLFCYAGTIQLHVFG